jgi:undecaprenyl-phosphate galactose phosphotransferase/putative colanic acid biosynthesis UDP-glucose lipid carrier transferase
MSGSALKIDRIHTRQRAKIGYLTIRPLCASAEFSIVATCSIVTGSIYSSAKIGFPATAGADAAMGMLAAVVYVGIAHHLKLHNVHELLRGYCSRVLLAWSLTMATLTLFLFVFRLGNSISRGSTVGFAVLAAVCLLTWRNVVAHYLRSAFESGAIRGRRAVVFGNTTELASLTARDLLLNFGIEEIERLSFTDKSAEGELSDTIKHLLQSARRRSATEVILAISWSDSYRLDLIRKNLRRLPVLVRLLPDRSVSALISGSALWATHSYAIELQRAPLDDIERHIKRCLDFVVACAALVLLAPLITIVAVAIKLDSPGPVIFKQRRKGFNEKKFNIYKFRTMTVAEDGPGVVQAKRGDKRVTRVGRLLRESSIDELPQLVNVIRGDMSLVGPRPHAVAHDAQYGRIIANYAIRHHVKPGITGLAQVHGYRGETAQPERMAERIELDVEYINGWSIMLDIKILCRTFIEVFSCRNAY